LFDLRLFDLGLFDLGLFDLGLFDLACDFKLLNNCLNQTIKQAQIKQSNICYNIRDGEE
jgi:hypothetical protein